MADGIVKELREWAERESAEKSDDNKRFKAKREEFGRLPDDAKRRITDAYAAELKASANGQAKIVPCNPILPDRKYAASGMLKGGQ